MSDLGLTAKGNMTKKKTIKTLSSKIVFKDKLITVYKRDVLGFDGKKRKWSMIEKRDFALVIPVVKKKFCLVRQYRYAVGQKSWEFPQGNSEKGESLLKCAKRELEEETGLKAKKFKSLGYLWVGCGQFTQGFTVYLARDCQKGKQKLKGFEKENMQVEFFSFHKIFDMIKSGLIKDSQTVAAMNLYLCRDKKK